MPAPDAAPGSTIDPDLDLVLRTVADAGRLAMKHLQGGTRHWHKKDGTPVSDADHAVDRLLENRLRGARPTYGWLSEESEGDALPADRPSWIVDPIDGTRAFLSGQQHWCVCVALVRHGRPVVGVVHAPALRQTFAASVESGATLNGDAIAVSGRRRLEASVVLANRAAFRPERWSIPLPHLESASLASLALRLCSVATGAADAALALTYKHDWDLAAGDLIVCEAGGKVSDLTGNPLYYGLCHGRRGGFIAATPSVHTAIVAHGPKTAD